ncbi:MAG: SPFH domain-containing protein, partial [Lachnospiraceae bacterium]|nr:SPFH domain-containing protein [Lachnospiraceae bacterium]
DLRGINIASISINSVKANEEDEKRLKDAQERAVYRDPNMGAAAMALSTANAMEAAASNTSTGPMMAFAGMNMASMMGGQQAVNMYQMGQAQQMYQQPQMQPQMQAGAVAGAPVNGWTCSCGTAGNTGKFCTGCGAQKPSDAGWTCSCGTVNQGNFCSGCGAKRPAGAPLYKCDKCGFEPEDPANPPKFCPQCGDPFNEADIKQ